MTLNSFVTQAWRFVRLGGVAALAGSQASTKVATSDRKTLIIVGAVAGVEVIYRALVPAKDQSKLATLYKNFRAFLATQTGQQVEKAVEAAVPEVDQLGNTTGAVEHSA